MGPNGRIMIFPNVHLGRDVRVDAYCILGQPARGQVPGASPLWIGDSGLLRSHTVLYAGSTIGRRFETGHGVLIRENAVIGDDCSVGSGSVVEFSVRMAADVRLHSQCFVAEYTVLEAGCWLGPRVVITNALYPAAARTKQSLQPVRIGPGAKVGANVTLLPGVVLGAGCLVGAGAVVTKDVPEDMVVVGNPARPVNRVSELRDAAGLIYGIGS